MNSDHDVVYGMPVIRGAAYFSDSNYFYHKADPSFSEFMRLMPIDEDYDSPANVNMSPNKLNHMRLNDFMRDKSLYRKKRHLDLESENVEQYDMQNDRPAFDESQLLKIRLSIGPLILNEADEVSCSLRLINSHNANMFDLKSTIRTKINKNPPARASTKPISLSKTTTTTTAAAKTARQKSKSALALEEIRNRETMSKSSTGKRVLVNWYVLIFSILILVKI